MTDKLENQTTPDAQPAYDPPQALRVASVRAGAGLCSNQGSGDYDYCNVGNNAGGDGCGQGIAAGGCAASGNAAASCFANGETAAQSCSDLGNGF